MRARSAWAAGGLLEAWPGDEPEEEPGEGPAESSRPGADPDRADAAGADPADPDDAATDPDATVLACQGARCATAAMPR
jgi:hypothetical protein